MITVFVGDTDFGAISGPLHAANRALVPIVDHFFIPDILEQCPDHNHPRFIRCGQFTISTIPDGDGDGS